MKIEKRVYEKNTCGGCKNWKADDCIGITGHCFHPEGFRPYAVRQLRQREIHSLPVCIARNTLEVSQPGCVGVRYTGYEQEY